MLLRRLRILIIIRQKFEIDNGAGQTVAFEFLPPTSLQMISCTLSPFPRLTTQIPCDLMAFPICYIKPSYLRWDGLLNRPILSEARLRSPPLSPTTRLLFSFPRFEQKHTH